MAVSKRLRYEVMRRDDHACRYCGAKAPDVKLTVDHVIPIALGGSDKPENLVTACADCNAGKSSSSPDAPIVANVSDDALRWARAMQLAAARAAEVRDEQVRIATLLGKAWRSQLADWAESENWFLPADWEHSLFRFMDAGLTHDDLAMRMHYTLTRDNVRDEGLWRYFCGACWGVLEDRQKAARHIIDSGEAD